MKQSNFDTKKSSLIFLMAFLIAQIVLTFWQSILKFILKSFHYHNVDNFVSNPFLYMIFTLAQTLVFVGIFIFSLKQLNLKKEIKQKRFDWKLALIFIAFGIISIFSLAYFINYVSMTLNLLGQPSTSLPYQINDWFSYVFSIISLAILPAVGEELLFRATIFNGLKSKSKLFAVVMSSIMFTIFHFSLSQFYYPLLFGMLLGIAYATTENIFVPMIMHFLNNAINITLQFATNNSYSSPKIYMVIIGIVVYLAILFASLLILYKKENKSNEPNVANDTLNEQNTKENQTGTAPLTSHDQTKLSTSSTPQNNGGKITSQDKPKQNLPFYKTQLFGDYWPFGLMVILYLLLIFV